MKNKILKAILSTITVIVTCNLIMFLFSMIMGTVNQSYIIFTGCLNAGYVLTLIKLSAKVDIIKMFKVKNPFLGTPNIKQVCSMIKRR